MTKEVRMFESAPIASVPITVHGSRMTNRPAHYSMGAALSLLSGSYFLPHHSIAALRSPSARGMGVTFGLQLPDAFDDINHTRNEDEDSRHDHDEPQRQKSQLQHHPRDRAHLTNSRHLARPTWFQPHFVADEIMQNSGTDQNYRVARNDENREPYRKFSVIGIALAPIGNAQGDDAAQQQTFVGDRVENNA